MSSVASSIESIAVIGMAGRFPGAPNIDRFWSNLTNGVESISRFSADELRSQGVSEAELADPGYVKAGAILEDVEWFDAGFFDYNPREAEVIDPQQRIFLESAWEALEGAGYYAQAVPGPIGVFAGASPCDYWNILRSAPDSDDAADAYQHALANAADFLTTRVSYKLDLRGPSFTVATACSTSLVAVHLACLSLLTYQCDLALAGGVSVRFPQKRGYRFQEGMILSPDGHCRAFDARARGTIPGQGVGIVVLKRLSEALAHGDTIHAVIKGSAINNDGAMKVGFTAPSVDGQADVIAMAQAVAGTPPESIAYVEAHGTGTPLGDPIEIAALTQAFEAGTRRRRFCAVGSLKTNIGHLDAAAGVGGLIKAILALKHRQIPPSLHFEKPNPEIEFANSPFYVNAELRDWKSNSLPRRAAVSSFGIGGTNAHVVLEEAPPTEPSGKSRTSQLLLLSAKTKPALDAITRNLAEHLEKHSHQNLADVAFTLQNGRKPFTRRRMLVCQDRDGAVTALKNLDPKRVLTVTQEALDREVVYMFSGQGAQYANMGLDLYQTESVFRQQVDRCSEVLKPHLGMDIREIIYPGEKDLQESAHKLRQTFVTQPALFLIEYALAQLWMAWGIRPRALIGHSIGEYVAACLSGVFTLEDAMYLVATRGRLIQGLPAGSMLAVPLSDVEIQPYLDEDLSTAAINAPSLCVVSGTHAAVDALERQLADKQVKCRRLHTSHAFHSKMITPIVDVFKEYVKGVRRNAPQIPFLSNVSGTWITAADAVDPGYWARHLREPVRFSDGLGELSKEPGAVLLEVGPSNTLSTLARQRADKSRGQIVLHSLRHPKEHTPDDVLILETLGRLWLAGVRVDWTAFSAEETRRRVPLPTYPFQRQRFWIEPQKRARMAGSFQAGGPKSTHIADWFYTPSWKRTARLADWNAPRSVQKKSCWLVFLDDGGLGTRVVERLRRQGHDVTTIEAADRFHQAGRNAYLIDPRAPEDYDSLFGELRSRRQVPEIIAHFWSISHDTDRASRPRSLEESQEFGFYSLVFMAQALGRHEISSPVRIVVVTDSLHEVDGRETLTPERATVLGPCKVIPQEYPGTTCRNVDLIVSEAKSWEDEELDRFIAELASDSRDDTVAYRGRHRWVQTFVPIPGSTAEGTPPVLRPGGVYVISGGLGRVGLDLAESLARSVKAKLVLFGRSVIPSKNDWAQWLETHDRGNEISRKIRRIQILERLGSEVMVLSADVANREQMLSVMKQAEARFVEIHGMIHAAGVVDHAAFLPIRQLDQTVCERQFRPKIDGLLVLENLLRERNLDFCLLTSSLSSVLGGLGYAAYAAANIFMDAFAHNCNCSTDVPWISVNWDGWKRDQESDPPASVGGDLARLTIEPEEGMDAFLRILRMGRVAQVIVSTGDLQARIDRYLNPDLPCEQNRKETETAGSRYARPELANAYEAPRNELEETISGIWEKLLGIENVGVHDNFFELGGHSLLATQVISRLGERLQLEIPLRYVFESPTIAGMAESIEALRWARKNIHTPSDLARSDTVEGTL